MPSLADFKAIVKNPPPPGLSALSSTVFHSSNTTTDLVKASSFACTLTANAVENCRDIWRDAEMRVVGDEIHDLVMEEAQLKLRPPSSWSEAKMRDGYRQLIMQAVKLRRRMEHVIKEIRSRKAKERKRGSKKFRQPLVAAQTERGKAKPGRRDV